MQPCYVRDVMRSPVITVGPKTSLPMIKELMRQHHIRRLPVVDRDQLVGIITLGDVRNALPSDATSLSVFEVSYLLDQVTARDLMRQTVITTQAAAPIVYAVRLMLHHKIGGVPVLDGNELVGILAESDILRAILQGTLELKPVVSESVPVPRTRWPIV